MSDTVATVLDRAAGLIPGARSTRLATHAAWCCTPAATLPERFRAGQEEHTAAYMAGRGRGSVPGAVRYFVTSYGTPVAWVLYDGSVHYAADDDMARAGYFTSHGDPQFRTMRRHRDAIRAVWPAAFVVKGDGHKDREVHLPVQRCTVDDCTRRPDRTIPGQGLRCPAHGGDWRPTPPVNDAPVTSSNPDTFESPRLAADGVSWVEGKGADDAPDAPADQLYGPFCSHGASIDAVDPCPELHTAESEGTVGDYTPAPYWTTSGTEGQDRESYTDDQDRDSYTADDAPAVETALLALLRAAVADPRTGPELIGTMRARMVADGYPADVRLAVGDLLRTAANYATDPRMVHALQD